MNRIFGLLVLIAASFACNAALAHGNTKPLHGGVLQMVGETSFELVTKADGAELYVVDDGEDVSSATMTARLMIDAGGAKSEAAMPPAGGNKFEAKGVKIPSGAKVAVLLTGSDQSRTTARFTIK
jgi:hypothetical protein